MVDMVVVKDDVSTRLKEWKAKFLCRHIGHTGPTVRSGEPVVLTPFKPDEFRSARYLIRRCSRFRCGTEFSTPLDLIG